MASQTQQFSNFGEWMSAEHPHIPKKVQVTHLDGTPDLVENKDYKNKRSTYNRLKKEHANSVQLGEAHAEIERLRAELAARDTEAHAEIERLRAELAASVTEVATLKQDKVTLQQANATFVEEVTTRFEELIQENTGLKQEVRDLRTRLASATAASTSVVPQSAGGGAAQSNSQAKYTTRGEFILARFDLTEMPPSKIESRNKQGRVLKDGQGKVCRRSNPEYSRIQGAWKKYRKETGQFVTTKAPLSTVTRPEPVEYDSTTDEYDEEVVVEEWTWKGVNYFVDDENDVMTEDGDVVGKRIIVNGEYVLTRP